jgi:hypothetical protein
VLRYQDSTTPFDIPRRRPFEPFSMRFCAKTGVSATRLHGRPTGQLRPPANDWASFYRRFRTCRKRRRMHSPRYAPSGSDQLARPGERLPETADMDVDGATVDFSHIAV